MTDDGDGKKYLLAAADYIEQHGWCQGALEDHGRVCVVEAVIAVGGGLSNEAGKLLTAVIGDNNWPGWNDQPGRTKEEVVAALRQAALATVD